MNSNLAIMPRATFDERPNALLIDHVTYDEWLARGKALYAAYDRIKWHLVDWIAYGMQHFPDELEQAVFEAKIPGRTVTNNWRIFRTYPTEQDRVMGCSVSAHEAAIVLPPQQRYRVLEQAAREGEGRDWVRDEVKRIKGDGGKVEPEVLFRTVSADGKLHAIEQLPTHMWGKDVQITIKVLEKVA